MPEETVWIHLETNNGSTNFVTWKRSVSIIGKSSWWFQVFFSVKTSKITFFEFWIFISYFGHNMLALKTGWNFSKWHILWNEDIFSSSSKLYQRSQETIMVFLGGKSSKNLWQMKVELSKQSQFSYPRGSWEE